jgi:long-chain fatty acid transport protein
MIKTGVCTTVGMVVMGALLYAGASQAGGFQITEICAACQGVRNAGMAASSVDTASALYFNPATMTRLSGGNVDFSLHYLINSFDFDNDGSHNAIPAGPGSGPASGDNNSDGGENALIPTLFYSQQLNPQWAVGFGANVPYGLATEYDKSWVGRYNAVKSELITNNFNLAVAYRPVETFAIGVGFNALYADAELTNSLDYGTLAFVSLPPPVVQALGITPSTQRFDGFQKLTGNDWGFGWNIGVLFEPMTGTRFGVAYRSDIDTTLNGDVKITGNSNFQGTVLGTNQKINAKADLTAPATLIFGAYHELNSQLALMAGITWTNWSEFNELRVKLDNGRTSVQPENWEDSWRYSIGVQYQYDPRLTLRGGFEYDETPVKNKYRTPRVPDEDRYWFVVGAGYRPNEAFSFDFAYTYLFTPRYEIDDEEVTTNQLAGGNTPLGNVLEGHYESYSHIFSAQVAWNF